MRFIVSAAITMAIITLSVLSPRALSAQEAVGGHKIAVVDVAYIFKNHEAIKAQVSKVENDLKAFDAEVRAKREELTQLVEQLKVFKVGSPDYAAQEERIAEMESKLRLDMTRKRKEMADAEAKIYYENYKHIAEGVKYLANYYKINLVLRYNSEDMNPDQGDSVIRAVMKNVVFHDDGLDMTKGVMQYLDQTLMAKGQKQTTNR